MNIRSSGSRESRIALAEKGSLIADRVRVRSHLERDYRTLKAILDPEDRMFLKK
jgi:hypothetical protein